MGTGYADHPVENKDSLVPFGVREADEQEADAAAQARKEESDRHVETLVIKTMTKTADD